MAEVAIDEQGVIRSLHYDDIYFAPQEGESESRYVFLEGNDLAEAFEKKSSCVIGEMGFGTGLNFLLTLQLWKAKNAEVVAAGGFPKKLYYYSVDKHPLTKMEIEQALRCYPDLREELLALLEVYPRRIRGMHYCALCDGHVRLVLMWGDAAAMWRDIDVAVDAWFLDGFAPNKNPEMWSEMLFLAMADCSYIGTRLTTFTAAGFVRRGLEAVGFDMKKRKGFGKKREMLVGVFAKQSVRKESMPWFVMNDEPWEVKGKKVAVVVGAGIAGCSVARQLAQRGWQVTVVDKENAVAQGASNHERAILFPALNKKRNEAAQLSFWGYEYSARLLERLSMRDEGIFEERPMVQFGKNEEDFSRLVEGAKLVDPFGELMVRLDGKELDAYVGGVDQAALLYLGAKAVNVKKLCEVLLQHEGIEVVLEKEVKEIVAKDEGGHVLMMERGEKYAEKLVICTAGDAKNFSMTSELPMIKARGQVSYLPKEKVQKPFEAILCYGGYAIAEEGRYVLGATFDPDCDDENIRVRDHVKNIALLKEYVDVAKVTDSELVEYEGVVGFRTVTADRFPLVGAMPDEVYYREQYGDLHSGKRVFHYPNARYKKDVYVSLAFGARGLVYAPLMGEMLAAEMNGEPSFMPRSLRHAVHPARFWIRNFRKNGK